MSEYPGMQYNRRNTILPLSPFPPPRACQRYSTADEYQVEDAEEDISAAGGDDDDALCNSLSLPARFVLFALKLLVIGSGIVSGNSGTFSSFSSLFFLVFLLPSTSTSSSIFFFSSLLFILMLQ